MYKKNYIPVLLLIVIFIISSNIVFSQSVTWVKTYGDSVKDMEGVSIIQTYDGGYIVLVSKGNVTSDDKMILIKLDYLGNLQWQKFPADTVINIRSIKLVQTKDSGFAILGDDFTANINFLLKTDKNGNFLWRKNYPDTALADARIYGFTKTLDYGFILCGNYTSYFPTSENGYLIKTDSAGNVKWQKGYIDSLFNNYGDIIQFPDSNYYIAGYTRNTYSNSYAMLKKIGLNGNVIWTKFLINNIGVGAGTLTKILNDKIAVWSTQQSYGYFISLVDTSSNIIWQNFYTFPDQLNSLNSISSGNIIISGFVLQGGSIGINKLSLTDSSIFTKTFLHPGYSLIGVRNTANTNDGGFILTGGAQANKRYVLVIKTDSLFNAPIIMNLTNKSDFISDKFELYQSYPNPFNPSTTIKFNIPENGFVQIKIFDITGKEILNLNNQFYLKGLNKFSFDANKYNLCSGIYLFTVEFKGNTKSNKLVFIK